MADTVHGIRGSRIVTESSSDRDRFSGARFCSRCTVWNNSPTINAVTPPCLVRATMVAPEAKLAAVRLITESVFDRIAFSNLSSPPETSMAAANKKAAIPLAKAMALSPPSRRQSFCSRAVTVGLSIRE